MQKKVSQTATCTRDMISYVSAAVDTINRCDALCVCTLLSTLYYIVNFIIPA